MYSNKESKREPASNVVKGGVKLEETGLPYVRIVEQPRSRGLRFRYQCEDRRTSTIEGENTSDKNKTYPTIEIVNNRGPAFVVVSCVTMEYPYRPHPHGIDGRGKEFSRGICYLKVPAGQNIVVFPRMSIQCVKKSQAMSALEERKRLKVNPFMTDYPGDVKNIDMTAVRLCFQVFVQGKQEGNFNVPLEPVVTQPIYDKKTAVDFDIKWISHHAASVAGGKVICIISDKMVKDDIQVIFFCEKTGWEAEAKFTHPHFHRQVAVVLETPAYLDQEVTEPVEVQVKLRRPTNGKTSAPVPFQLLPLEATNRDSQRAKRLRLCSNPRAARTIVEQHIRMENHQTPVQLSRNVSDALKKPPSLPQVQRSNNQQSIKVEEMNPPYPQRETSNQYHFQYKVPQAQHSKNQQHLNLEAKNPPNTQREFSNQYNSQYKVPQAQHSKNQQHLHVEAKNPPNTQRDFSNQYNSQYKVPQAQHSKNQQHLHVENRNPPHAQRESSNQFNFQARVSQAQHSKNQQSIKVEESNPPNPQREFSNQCNFQARPSPPETPVEFKQLLDRYLYGDRRPDFLS